MKRNAYLKKVFDEVVSDEERALRTFDTFDAFQGTPEDYWGMPIEMPEWLEQVHNARSGRTFMVGSGPSLTRELPHLSKLNDEFTFSVNRLRQWKDLPFTPGVHGVAEPGPILDWGRQIGSIYDFPEAHVRIAVNWWPVTAPGWLWVPKAPDDIQMRWEGFFGLGDTLPPLPTGWASPLTMAQVAAWFGFREFYFLGCDTTQVGQAWDITKGRTAEVRNIRSILECYERARRDIERAGGKVYDCSHGGRLNQEGVLEYVELGDVL